MSATFRTASRKILLIGIWALGAVVAVEALSSYVLFRYFAKENKSYTPVGSSTYQLLDHAVVSARGDHKRVQLTSEPFPLFAPDDELGYVLNPGDYRILEDYDNHKHAFHLHVTDQRGRATSYVPVTAPKRFLFTGDSSMFGWAVNDEETIPWLLQSRMPHDEVVNLSLTSYSTVQTLIQLRNLKPKLGADDTLMLLYHPVTSDFNVAVPSKLDDLILGYELQLGESKPMLGMKIPFGAISNDGKFEIRAVELSCARRKDDADCKRTIAGKKESVEVTKRAFDEILALHPGRVFVALISGPNDDPVIAYLVGKGVTIADLRLADDEPDAQDVMATDKHAGPYWQYRIFERLFAFMRKEGMVH